MQRNSENKEKNPEELSWVCSVLVWVLKIAYLLHKKSSISRFYLLHRISS